MNSTQKSGSGSAATPKLRGSPPLWLGDWRDSPLAIGHRLTKGRYQAPPHLVLLEELVVPGLVLGGLRLLPEIPVRHGKSRYLSQWLLAWFLGKWPHKTIMLGSYQADYAATLGRRVREIIREYGRDLGVELNRETTAADRWETTAGGGMVTAGVGGPFTGRGADLMIIDDPVKNREEANSETLRNKTWEWWTDTAYTRLEPGASAILVMSRWHADDLSGRIQAEMKSGGEAWEVVRLPAVAEEDPPDPLGRKPGQALWPERYDEAALKRIRRTVGSFGWASLYQQRPALAEGHLFKRGWLQGRFHIEMIADAKTGVEVPVYCFGPHRVARSKLAVFAVHDSAVSAKTTADYSVGLVCAAWSDGGMRHLLLLGMYREQAEAPVAEPKVRAIAKRFGARWIAVEDTAVGKSIYQRWTRDGEHCRLVAPISDKVTRSTDAQVGAEQGRFWFPEGEPWVVEVVEELIEFPTGKHDDIVDCVSYAFILLPTACAVRVSGGERAEDGTERM